MYSNVGKSITCGGNKNEMLLHFNNIPIMAGGNILKGVPASKQGLLLHFFYSQHYNMMNKATSLLIFLGEGELSSCITILNTFGNEMISYRKEVM